jgi:hypothetical protein
MPTPIKPEPRLESPVKKPLHAAAVDFAQSVVELQRARDDLEIEVNGLREQLMHERAENQSLKIQINEAVQKLDYYHRRVVEIETKFDIVGKVVLEVLHSSPIHPEDKPTVSLTDGTEAIRKVLDQVATGPEAAPSTKESTQS